MPKYWHYFIAAIILDFLTMYLVLASYRKDTASLLFLMGTIFSCWFLANLVFYPTSNQRYVSYLHSYYRVIKVFSLFSVLYWLAVRVFYGQWVYELGIIKFMCLLLGVILLNKILFVLIVRLYRSLGYGVSNYIIVGTPRDAVRFRRMLGKKHVGGYKFAFSVDSFHPYIANENPKAFKDLMKKYAVDEIYIFPNCSKQTFEFLSDIVTDTHANFFLIPKDTVKHIEFYNFRMINSASYSEIINGPLLKWGNRFFKRAFDIVFSSFVIVFILSWLIPILALIIKLDSKGSVFFIQPRAGLNGKPFNCIKLRTMRANSSAHTKQATKNDPRITRIGAMLRSTSLDEFPQFFNVFMGSMSIVGPRPHIAVLNEKYGPVISDYDKRFLSKPGITGLAQAYGYRGETKGVDDMSRRVNADIVYVQNWSLLLDVRIVFRTVRESVFFRDSNAY